VLIVAVLATIAIPNLLAAQTRSKVSRAHQELRVIQLGIESYRVSSGRIPYDGEPGSVDVGWAASLSAMTTPVAYLTSIPADVFQSPDVKSFPFAQSHMVFPATTGPYSYQYDSRRFLRVEVEPALAPDWSATFGSAIYLLKSCGTDLSESGLNPPS
jgi:type II secretory pathway pseudopilin PulG